MHGVLNLIDLAGSERLSRSGATGDRLKETQVGIIAFCYLVSVAIKHIFCAPRAGLIPGGLSIPYSLEISSLDS